MRSGASMDNIGSVDGADEEQLWHVRWVAIDGRVRRTIDEWRALEQCGINWAGEQRAVASDDI
jgi:hypothetical protein